MGPKARGKGAAARGSCGRGRGRGSARGEVARTPGPAPVVTPEASQAAGVGRRDNSKPLLPDHPSLFSQLIRQNHYLLPALIIGTLCGILCAFFDMGGRGRFHIMYGGSAARVRQETISVSTVTLTVTKPGTIQTPTSTSTSLGVIQPDKGSFPRRGPPRKFDEMCGVTLRWAWGGFGPGDRSLYDIMGVSPVVCPSSLLLSSCPPSFSHTEQGSAVFREALEQAYYKRTEGLDFDCRVGRGKSEKEGGGGRGSGEDSMPDDGGVVDDWTIDKVSAVCPSLLLARPRPGADHIETKCARATLITRAFRLLMDRASREVYDLEFLSGIAEVEVIDHSDPDVDEAWIRRVEKFCNVS